jgi:hypothetical protein
MAVGDVAARVGPFAERLLENQYAQENLRVGVESLQAAYRRASKRGVKPAEDKKLREQVRRGAASIAEATRAVKSGRQKPKRRRGRRIMLVVGAAAVGAAVAFASSEELRRKLLGPPSEDLGVGPLPADAVAA